MKVMVVSGGLPNKDSVCGTFEYDQAKALCDCGHEVIILRVDLHSARIKRKLGFSYKEINGMKAYSIGIPLGAVSAKIFDYVNIRETQKLYKRIVKSEGNPDIVHSHFFTEAVAAAELCEKNSLPFVHTEHSSLLNKSNVSENLVERVKPSFEKADAVIAVGTSLCDNIKKNIGIDTLCVPNIVDTSVFTVSERRKESDGIFTFVSVGNLVESKNFSLLLDAFAKIYNKNKNMRLVICGGGSLLEQLKAKSVANGTGEAVEFTGRIPREKINEIFAEAQSFVLPSKTETFGVAYIEALAAGLPVIATKCGGPEDFVTSDVGMLIKNDDLSELTAAMERMISNYKSYDSVELSHYVKERFSPERIAQSLTDVYVQVLKRKDSDR